ncbi:MAG TPA: 2Fe-2S iron-sulfur cluster-binding protein [Saprospiraceae bacterium]|nr:2Fe-2S iron-sulfur cluster-binding protein [Saprospiraceae bacterium]
MNKFQFYPCKVRKINQETKDCVSLELEIDSQWKNQFSFKAGQYLTFKWNNKEREIRRSYSLCAAPYEKLWKVAVKRVEGGVFSTFVNEELREGDRLEVMVPQGQFILSPDSQKRLYVFFAAGSGVTPIMSMIKEILHQTHQEVLLFYGNRSTDTIIFREEIEALKNKHLGRMAVHYILSREKPGSPLFFGRIDAEKCNTYMDLLFNPEEVAQYLICGPEKMIFEVEKALIIRGVAKSQIKFELFVTENRTGSLVTDLKKNSQSGPLSLIRIKIDGVISELELPQNGISILDAAIHAGADLPFSCKGGVCSTCKAKIVEGRVKMDVCYALEEDEVERGYILTCQSHPQTENVMIDFDEN